MVSMSTERASESVKDQMSWTAAADMLVQDVVCCVSMARLQINNLHNPTDDDGR